MRKAIIKIFTLIGVFMIAFCKLYGQDEFQIIQSKIDDHLKAEVKNDLLTSSIAADWPRLQKEGSYADINYSSTIETAWPPLLHLKRLNYLTLAYVIKENKYFNQQEVLAGIISGLRYWYAQNPSSSNWFQNDIAVPTALGEILILLNHNKINFPVFLQDSLLQRMQQGNVYKSIGANKVDIATHMLYRACITKDKTLMATALEQAFYPISFTSKQGLQYDYSYLQHGPQLQIASYGEVFLKGEYKVASWVQGTIFALSADKLKILNNYLINSYLKTIRGRYIDFNTEGRGISRNDILDKKSITESSVNNSLLGLAKKASPENTGLINEAQDRINQIKAPSYKILPSHTHFWKADYTLHTRPTYSFNVRSVSKRTVRAEVGNNENLLGKFLPDGSTNIQRSGAEYFNIMPIWEWDKIPGITSRDYQEDQPFTIEWGERGVGYFTGGVSDSLYGASVYDFNYNEVTAKKAWFFFDKQVVCLGAGINSFATQNIVTTINQSWLKGKVLAYADEKLSRVKSKKSMNNPSWIWHDSIGYYFPDSAQLQITNQKQKGSWAKINANRSKEAIEGKVFKMWFNHGVDPADATYAYIVRPGISQQEMQIDKQQEIKILANSKTLQAVKNEALNILQVVFYEAGVLSDEDITIKVDQPCMVMVKNIDTKNPEIHLADPTQKLKEVNISISSKIMKREDKRLLVLPKDNFAGSTMSYIIN
ncbi:polysaccharide lyase 8 family protein [Pedobacter cryophilus]|uniref:Chondroitinase n=1 Tax=Pedobacter cryophilus TaxID=2571271 RepID=A0A4U1C2Z9_9SPHI|nr:polysaccharide lyase 8 family protein [Pedobacter cryophilus]TKC00196.1 chondroitinase [Pedobacter cryophilus]